MECANFVSPNFFNRAKMNLFVILKEGIKFDKYFKIMKRFPLVVLEGISYAGKTTLSNLCKQKEIAVLKELSEFTVFPETPKEDSEISIADKWFYEQHSSRTEDILKIIRKNSLILDRYFLSDLAYIYARYHTYNVGNMDFYNSLLTDGLNKKEILVPWFIYVSIDIDLYNSRRLIDEKNLKATGETNMRIRFPYPYYHNLFIKNQISFYDSFFKKNNDKVLIIDGSLHKDYLCEQILEFMKKLHQALPDQTLKL